MMSKTKKHKAQDYISLIIYDNPYYSQVFKLLDDLHCHWVHIVLNAINLISLLQLVIFIIHLWSPPPT